MTAMMMSPRASGVLSRLRVLIAEDDPGSRWALSTLLTKLGHDCEVARDGREAIEKAAAFAPEAIVMDLMMPVLSGVEAIRRLKADPRTRSIPIVALSANVTPSGATEARRAGCDAFLTKPLALTELLTTLRAYAAR